MRYLFLFILMIPSCFLYAQSLDSTEIKKEAFQTLLNKNVYDLIGSQLPAFQLEQLDGNMLLSESLKGKPTVINYWSIYCSPCISEMPVLNEIKEEFAAQVNFIAFASNDKADVTSFLTRRDFNFDHVVDVSKYTTNKLGIIGFPITLIIDKDLIIRYVEKKPSDPSNDKEIAEAEFKKRMDGYLTELMK